MPDLAVTLADIYHARQVIQGLVVRTPLIHSQALSRITGSWVSLKLENVQQTGSFKLRGATNKMFSLTAEQRQRGVIAVSSGNHGRAVAYIAQKLGTPATICLSSGVPSNKVEAVRSLGAELVIGGNSYDEAALTADRLQQERGLAFIQPFDDLQVIAGQGTIGLELMEDRPTIDTVLVPLSGGGILAGIAVALKAANPAIRVIGVSMERAPVMVRSLEVGHIVDLPEEPTLADALVGSIRPNRYTFDLCQRTIDDTVLVSEEEIAEAMVYLFVQHHLVVEGGAAVGVAALLSGRAQIGRDVCAVLTGGSVSPDLLLELVKKHTPTR